jgi:predicted nicotinamide N-methyase
VKPLQFPLLDYDMTATIEKMGSIPLHLWSIRNMDRALDELCTRYAPETPEEETRLLDLCPYFATVWPSSRALGAFMSERKSRFNKKSGIEVGCGLGLPSILAAKIGSSILATDFHPDVPYWLEKNASLNQVRIPYAHWDWTNPEPGSEIRLGTYDFVLASDVLYEKRHPADLVRALNRLIVPGGSIFLSDPGRSYLKPALDEFERLGFQRAEFTFDVEESSHLPEHRLEKTRSIQVFEFSC